MNSGLIKTCAILFLAFSLVAVKSQQTAPDVILFNGKIFTSDAAHPYVQALAIRGERIAATGDSAKIRTLAGPNTKEIDLGGRSVIPGINDAHNHLAVSPPNRIDLELKTPDSAWPEMKAAIAAAVLKAPKGTFIYGEMAWKIFRDPAVNRDTLYQAAPNNPVILETLTNHAWILNSAALARAGIRENQPDPVGGRYERSPDGRPTGVIREYAVFNVERTFSDQTSEADALAELHKTLSAAAKWWITTIQDMSNDLPPNGALHCWRNCLLQFEFA
jgi:predicted amidohydrolase YtcJ